MTISAVSPKLSHQTLPKFGEKSSSFYEETAEMVKNFFLLFVSLKA
jgi:hypothetical protein